MTGMMAVTLDSYSKIANSSSRVSLARGENGCGRFWRLRAGQKSATFLLGSEYIGKTEIFRQGLAVRHTEPHATRFKYTCILRKLL